jgi:hypothetical protein
MSVKTKEENINLLKEDYIDFIKTTIQETGGLHPSFTVFVELKESKGEEDAKIGLVHIPISNDFMQNDDTKDELVRELLPEISKTIKKDFIPYALAWASEVWVRRVDKDIAKSLGPDPNGIKLSQLMKTANKVEAIFINIESDANTNVYVYEIVRDGKQITVDGDLVDKIELIECDDFNSDFDKKSIGGRFSNLFHLFK